VHHFFKFSTQQSRGFVILALLSMFLVFLSQMHHHQYIEQSAIDYVDTVRVSNFALQKSSSQQFKNPKHNAIHYFKFNPNTISLEQWTLLGIKKYTGIRIKKYLDKGGEFKVKSDFSKIYGISAKDFSLLKPYILLPDTLVKPIFNHHYPSKQVSLPEIQDLNRMEVESLDKFQGIGEVLATRIVKYRNKLGGYFELSQLLEVYGLSEEVYLKMTPLLKVDQSNLIKIDINHVSIKDLGSHPYIGYKNAKLIVNYRLQHGDFHAFGDVLLIKELDLKNLSKAAPYFSFEYNN
jgi:DNA uptake protein ComE-like DNA-binding protein